MLKLPSTLWGGARASKNTPADSFKMTIKIKNFKNLADTIRNYQIKNKHILFDAIDKSEKKINLFLPLREKQVYCTWAKSLNGQTDGSHAKTSIVEKSFALRIKNVRCLVVPQGIINRLRISDVSHWFSFDKVCLSNPTLSQSDPQANIGFLIWTDSQRIYENTQLVIKGADEHQQDLYNFLTNLFLHNEEIKSIIADGDYPEKSNQDRTSPFVYSPFYFLADGDEEQCSEFFSRNINIRNPFEYEVGLEDVFIHQDDLRCLELLPRNSFPLLGDEEIDVLEKQLVQAEKISNFVPAIRKAFVKCWINQGSDYVFRANLPNPTKSKDANLITQNVNEARGGGQRVAKLASSKQEYGKIKMEETGLHKDMCSFRRNQLDLKGFEKQFTKLFPLIWSDSVKSQYYMHCEDRNQGSDVGRLKKKTGEGVCLTC